MMIGRAIMGRPFAVGHEAGAHVVCSREVKALDIAMSCMRQDRMLRSRPGYSFGFSLCAGRSTRNQLSAANGSTASTAVKRLS